MKFDSKGEQARAREYAQAAVDAAPNFFQAHAALAVAYFKAGRLQDAERHLDHAAALNPDYLPEREIRGVALFYQGRLREAVPVLENLVRRAPCRLTGRYSLARALLYLGDVARAQYHAGMARLLGKENGLVRASAFDWDEGAWARAMKP